MAWCNACKVKLVQTPNFNHVVNSNLDLVQTTFNEIRDQTRYGFPSISFVNKHLCENISVIHFFIKPSLGDINTH
jgi:hypothetical protein